MTTTDDNQPAAGPPVKITPVMTWFCIDCDFLRYQLHVFSRLEDFTRGTEIPSRPHTVHMADSSSAES